MNGWHCVGEQRESVKPHARERIKAQRRTKMKAKAGGTEDDCADEEGRELLEALCESCEGTL